MADPSDTLPVNHRRLRSDIAGATPTPWIAAPAGSPLMLRWYVLRNSAPRHANVSPHGRPHLFLLLCSGEPTADRCWDAIATGVAAYGLPVPVCHICPLSYARLYRYPILATFDGCLSVARKGGHEIQSDVPSLLRSRLA